MQENRPPVIGIPKALFYWKEPRFWEELFVELGFKVVVSPDSNKEIIGQGVKVSDSETCFSVKVLFGHLAFLEEKQEVDFIFVPRYMANEEKLQHCPKFFGLPDVAKTIFKKEILTFILDERKKSIRKTIEDFCAKLVKKAGTKADVKKVVEGSLQKHLQREKEKEKRFFKKIEANKKKIALVSHPYNLYDDYVNVRVEKKINDLGGEVIFIDEVPPTPLAHPGMRFHWEFGKEIMERIETLKNYQISGAMQLSSFQCGCDAVLKEFVEKEFKNNNTPFFYLIIDEHTGEAGVQTRVEAFWDTL